MKKFKINKTNSAGLVWVDIGFLTAEFPSQSDIENNATRRHIDFPLTLQKDGNNETLPKDGNNQTMHKDGNNQTFPKDGNNQTLPKDGNNQTLPKDGNNQTFPKDGNNQTLPKDGNNQTLPMDGNNQTLTKDGNNQTFPKDGIIKHFQNPYWSSETLMQNSIHETVLYGVSIRSHHICFCVGYFGTVFAAGWVLH